MKKPGGGGSPQLASKTSALKSLRALCGDDINERNLMRRGSTWRYYAEREHHSTSGGGIYQHI